MPIIAKESGTDFKPVSSGTKGARCFAVIDLGTQPTDNPKYRPSRKVLTMFEIPEETYELDGKQIPMTIMREYSTSLGKKTKPSNLRKDLDSWRGRPFTEEEAAGFDLQNILGVPCMLSIAHYTKRDGNTGAKIAAITGLPKGMQVPELQHDTVYYEIDMGKGEAFRALPEWIQTKISGCLEWCPAATAPVATQTEAEPEDTGDESVPF